jgi:hypothetical protein
LPESPIWVFEHNVSLFNQVVRQAFFSTVVQAAILVSATQISLVIIEAAFQKAISPQLLFSLSKGPNHL